MRLQQKAVLFTLPFILIPTLILGWLSIRYTESAQREIEHASLQTDVNYRSDSLAGYFAALKNSLSSVLNSSDFRTATRQWRNDGNIDVFHSALKQQLKIYFSNNQEALAVRIYDNRLTEVTTFWRDQPIETLSTSHLLKTYADLHILPQEELSQSLAMVQLSWFSDDDKNKSMLHSIGFIQLISQPDWANTLRLNNELGNNFTTSHQVVVTSKSGKVLLAYPQLNLGRELPSQIFDKLMATSEDHGEVQVVNNGIKMNFAGRMVAERFLVLYGHQQQSVFAADTTYTWVSILTVILTILISPILLYVNFTRIIVEPIEKLTTAKRQVAQGNLDIKLDVPRQDEIGDLFAAFNVMVRQLIVYRENESESRLKLEYKVKERTEELESTNSALAKSNKALESAKELSEQANELKSAFVANISHEIRTPLTAILGFTEQVLSTELKNEHQIDLLNRVLKSGRHLLALINDILDLSKIESNKLDIEIRQVDLFELLKDVNTILASQASKKNLSFNFDFQFPLPVKIWTDSTRLRQILINLASNAIKFTEQGAVKIEVWFEQNNNKLFIEVTDTGIGMSEEVQQRLFSPFVQADVSISRKFGGTGLGLVISKSLAKLLGGDIVLESELHKGSKFTVDIKVADAEHPLTEHFIESKLQLEQLTEHSEKSIESNDKAISGRVLVAEDVEDNQYLFSMLLDSLHLDYDIVGNGKMAVEKVLTEDYDLILMDMQMPIMGGLEATKLIRQAGVDVPIYALTANVMREDIAMHLEAGCDGTIAKPIDKAELITVLKSHLSEEKVQSAPLIDDAKMQELTKFYLSQLAEQYQLLQTLDAPDKVAELKSECHKIKGSAGSYGFNDLTDLAAELENTCKVLMDANEGAAINDIQWQTIKMGLDNLLQRIQQLLTENT